MVCVNILTGLVTYVGLGTYVLAASLGFLCVLQVIDEADGDGKTPLMWAAIRVFKYVCMTDYTFTTSFLIIIKYIHCCAVNLG